jgi:hypothetical protein
MLQLPTIEGDLKITFSTIVDKYCGSWFIADRS